MKKVTCIIDLGIKALYNNIECGTNYMFQINAVQPFTMARPNHYTSPHLSDNLSRARQSTKTTLSDPMSVTDMSAPDSCKP